MKKEEYVHEKKLVDVSIEEVISEIKNSAKEDCDITTYEENELEDYIDGCLWDYEDVTPEERSQLCNKLIPILKEIRNKNIQEEKDQEIEQLSSRGGIIAFIEDVVCYNADDVGQVGYRLTSEEILDLILKNGVKNRS